MFVNLLNGILSMKKVILAVLALVFVFGFIGSIAIAKNNSDLVITDATNNLTIENKNLDWITHNDPNAISELGSQTSNKSKILPKAIKLDGIRYLQRQVILSFLDAAFSDFIWFEDTSPRVRVVSMLQKKSSTINSLPRHHVINKWRKPIKITFKTLENNKLVDKKKYSFLIDHLKDLIPIYSKVTGLKIYYTEEEFPERSDANVFIVLNAKSRIFNVFKNQRGGYHPDEDDYETNYVSAVRFTPMVRSQVEGFFIPDVNNEIKNATCYLKPSVVPEEWSKALLAECLGRLLGLPETSTNNSGLLSNWNQEFDDYSNLSALDGGNIFFDKTFQSWFEKVSEKLSQKSPAVIYPTEFDLKLLSTLYCPSIKPGMDKYEVVLSLFEESQCVE